MVVTGEAARLTGRGGRTASPVHKPRRRQSYDAAFKLKVVLEALKRPPGARIKPTCRIYPDIEPVQLRKWIRNAAALELAAPQSKCLVTRGPRRREAPEERKPRRGPKSSFEQPSSSASSHSPSPATVVASPQYDDRPNLGEVQPTIPHVPWATSDPVTAAAQPTVQSAPAGTFTLLVESVVHTVNVPSPHYPPMCMDVTQPFCMDGRGALCLPTTTASASESLLPSFPSHFPRFAQWGLSDAPPATAAMGRPEAANVRNAAVELLQLSGFAGLNYASQA